MSVSVCLSHATISLVLDSGHTLEVELDGGGCAGVTSIIHASVHVHCPSPNDSNNNDGDNNKRRTVSKYSVVLDAGGLAVPPRITTLGDKLPVLVSHLHADHCSGLHGIVASRSLIKQQTTLVVPALGGPGDVEAMLRLQLRMDQGGSNGDDRDKEKDKEKDKDQGRAWGYMFSVVPATPLAPIRGLVTSRTITPFTTFHRIPSVGFCIECHTRKLRAQYQGLDVRALRQQLPDDALFEVHTTGELAYTGDTTIEGVRHAANRGLLARVRVLVLECTYVDADTPAAKAQARGHVHVDDIAANAHLFEGVGALVLTHFSRKYSQERVVECLQSRLPSWLAAKTHALLLHSFHNQQQQQQPSLS